MPERPDTSALCQSGLDRDRVLDNGVSLEEVRFAQIFRVRAMPGGGRQPKSLNLPVNANEVRGDGPWIMCLRPGEWLVFRDERSAEADLPETGENLEPLDCTDGIVVLRLTGRAAPWLLSKIGSLDFPQLGATGETRMAQTRIGGVRTLVLLHAPGDLRETVFDLFVERPLARSVFELLAASMPHAARLANLCEGWSDPAKS